MEQTYHAFIGTNSVRGSQGIYTLDICGETIRILAVTPAYNAGGLALSRDGKNLYAASEGMTFRGQASGGITAFAVEPDGSLRWQCGQRSYGQRTCCVAVDDKKEWAYGCDFYQGTWSSYPVLPDGSLGPADRTVAPPPDSGWKALHCIEPIGSDFVGVISLAQCALVIYRAKDGTPITSFPFPEGSFPRYLAVTEEAIYAMLQSPDHIYVLENRLSQDGTLRHIQTLSLMDPAHQTFAATSTIRVSPNKALVMAANRPSNSITLYSRSPDGTLTMERVVDVPGNGPRDFNISQDGALVVVAMQHSDQVVVFRVDYDSKDLILLGQPVHVPSPAAVAAIRRCQ